MLNIDSTIDQMCANNPAGVNWILTDNTFRHKEVVARSPTRKTSIHVSICDQHYWPVV